ncbi:MAG TPA: glycosyl hydrolase [Abditibacteriaceae bacterium]|jgi:hypothetical protein
MTFAPCLHAFHPRSLFTLLLLLGLALLTGAQVVVAQTLAKFEPAQGCYIGAFIERDYTVNGDIGVFEELTKKKHASYFTYVGYGRPFPKDWVDKVRRAGAAPHIAFEPNEGLDKVQDSQYLRNWARDAARARCPIFLRWASEMNGPWTNYSQSAELYREKFRLMHKVMSEEAPNVAMVWTPFAEPQRLIAQYYPGDDYVDWVGLNVYSVYVNNGDPLRPAHQKDPLEWLQFIYDNYASRKPVHISEFAATIYCKGTGTDTVDFAIEKMTRFYDGIRERFPRIKSINYFVWDTIRAKRANNNYSFLDDGRVLATYRKLVSSDYFLTKVNYDSARYSVTPKAGTTVKGKGQSVDTEAFESVGAIAANLDRPYLRGIEDGDIFKDDIELRAQLPQGMEPRGLIWQIDGRTIALTNKSPYRVTVQRDRFAPGKHRAKVIVMQKNGLMAQQASPEVEFEFAP